MNNAGILQRGDVEFTPLDAYKKVTDVNLFGTIRMTKACLPLIRAEKGGCFQVAEGILMSRNISRNHLFSMYHENGNSTFQYNLIDS